MSYLLIGLGNPGEKYKNTRHNAGKMLARWLKEEGRRKKEEGKWAIVETECFMNESGGWVKSQLKKMAKNGLDGKDGNNPNNLNNPNPLNHLIVAHDDLDIPLGSFKIQFGKGPRLHKGVLSVEQVLGTKEFWRIRIGIDGRKKEEGRRKKEEGEEYVLEKFKPDEKKVLEAVFVEIRDRLDSLSFLRKQESI